MFYTNARRAREMFRRLDAADRIARRKCEDAGFDPDARDHAPPAFHGIGGMVYPPNWQAAAFRAAPEEIDAELQEPVEA